ncbi:hypothetical protein B0T18DRAFT_103015 [Schizothecium vesticola]|uniref:Uncharacterized protein n=1 Tax=Schizothecium vesticola TaxID=314040 RepID=A0AA40F1M7_9PEZI|nr:hypothetical protein B0T18DRAFT_103015 [Schizothecium vesticola]
MISRTCETVRPSLVRPPGSRREDISTLPQRMNATPATPAANPRVHEFTSAATPKKQNQAGYSDIRPSFPSSLAADLARMTVVWLEPTFPSLALAPINPISPLWAVCTCKTSKQKDAATRILGSCLSSAPTPRQTAAADAHNGEVTMGKDTLRQVSPSLFPFLPIIATRENDITVLPSIFQIVLPYQLPYSNRSTQYHSIHTPVRPEQRACSWGGIAGRS